MYIYIWLSIWNTSVKFNVTYYVPTMWLVFASSSFFLKALAIPKSDIFGFISSSNRMLLAFRSRWIIVEFEYSWKYRSPWITPSMVWTRCLQSKRLLLLGSVWRPITNHDQLAIHKLWEQRSDFTFTHKAIESKTLNTSKEW